MRRYSSLGVQRKKNILLKILVGITCIGGIVTATQTCRLIYTYQKLQGYKTQVEHGINVKSELEAQLEQIKQEVETTEKDVKRIKDTLQLYAPIVIPESMK
ncbi:hypothetical protein CS063_08300 [Sporanaerobium hydrogeniformans]|uniref:Uncharacterized protein n=1 Tax=Sporanaerobium hydrogeniformans TaxID=3072179 RepID=A0AC61DCX6_9FIRM|nr:hypothetical protein [Sporanaerobium hydrogeniformans]PHV70760.1 hypothetical protein CS063_08300 [Sporanaerobium hydrogeniformans]